MECLRDYIQIKWCGNTSTPPSGFYINDLQGIGLKQITSLSNEDHATFSDLWTTIQKRAELRFATDVRAAMASRYRVNSLLQGINVGREVGTTANIPDANNFKGFTSSLLDAVDFEYIPSPLSCFHYQSLSFYASGTDVGETVEVAIWDTLTGEKLFTTNVTLVSGWNNIEVNEDMIGSGNTATWSVFCGIRATALSTYDLTIPLYGSWATCCKSRIYGAQTTATSNIKSTDLTLGSSTFGLTGIYTVKCKWDAMVCQNKSLFTRAYLFCLGIELLTEQIYSTNLNSYTTINLQKAKELRDEYTIEYNKSLEQTCDNMHLACDCCVECSDSVQLVETNEFY